MKMRKLILFRTLKLSIMRLCKKFNVLREKVLIINKNIRRNLNFMS